MWSDETCKIARHCGAKHMSKSKCSKHLSFGALLEVEVSKKCTPLWREAHFQVKMPKGLHVRTTFRSCDVEKVHAVVVRRTFPSQTRSAHFWKLRCRKRTRCFGARQKCKKRMAGSDHFLTADVEKVHTD